MLSHLRGYLDDQSSGNNAPDGFYQALSSPERQKCDTTGPWEPSRSVGGQNWLIIFTFYTSS